MLAWFRLWRDRIRDARWSGVGTVVRKVHRDPIKGDAFAFVGWNIAFGSTSVPERWVLVVNGSGGREIYVVVEQHIWDAYDIGDEFIVRRGRSSRRGSTP